MASIPPTTSRELMTLGMFVFSIDTALYDRLNRSREWRHATAERFGARAAAQYVGPGGDNVSISGLIVPEIAGRYSALDTLADMAATGDSYPLMNGLGRILGHYRIVRLDEDHAFIMAGGMPRNVAFKIELERSDDETDNLGSIEGAAGEGA
ncbi:phage tail protein [Porphyrobacter sp. YT40]|uniref:phage tail protein n=1 Tax=Porphyrobacter sp. YT40 TaxID=2547601 RepID=UPI002573936F|nr:phage tail protein [Porphyrobacter sp. YT40]